MFVVVRYEVVVSGSEKTVRGIEDVRLRLDRQIAVPFVTPVTGNRNQTAPRAANGCNPHSLPTDVSVAVGPGHVFAGDVAVVARLPELLPRLCLIHPEARQIGSTTDFHPSAAYCVSFVVFGVLIHHRSVTCVLEIDSLGRSPLDRDRFLNNRHALPVIAVAVLIRVLGVRLVDVKVLAISRENGEAPCAVPIVSDGNPWNLRFATANHIPARTNQVHPVPEGWRRLSAVRIVGHDRETVLRQVSTYHPVIAPDILQAERLEFVVGPSVVLK